MTGSWMTLLAPPPSTSRIAGSAQLGEKSNISPLVMSKRVLWQEGKQTVI